MPTIYDFRDRVAVVTGGAQGIGRAIAARLLHGGATVWLWDCDAPLAHTTAAGSTSWSTTPVYPAPTRLPGSIHRKTGRGCSP